MIYSYQCPDCGTITDKFTSNYNLNAIDCPECKASRQLIVSAPKIVAHCSFQLKGPGWEADGYSSVKSNT